MVLCVLPAAQGQEVYLHEVSFLEMRVQSFGEKPDLFVVQDDFDVDVGIPAYGVSQREFNLGAHIIHQVGNGLHRFGQVHDLRIGPGQGKTCL